MLAPIRMDLLALLAKHLRNVSRNSFDIDTWSCGTTACAVGHAVNVPEIAKEGLALKVTWSGKTIPVYKKKSQWEAVEDFFKLSETDVFYLFSESHYKKDSYAQKVIPLQVAMRIEEFIECKSKY